MRLRPSELWDTLPLEDQALIHDACERLIRAWQEDGRPNLTPFLDDETGDARLARLYELISMDMELAQQAGEPSRFEHYH